MSSLRWITEFTFWPDRVEARMKLEIKKVKLKIGMRGAARQMKLQIPTSKLQRIFNIQTSDQMGIEVSPVPSGRTSCLPAMHLEFDVSRFRLRVCCRERFQNQGVTPYYFGGCGDGRSWRLESRRTGRQGCLPYERRGAVVGLLFGIGSNLGGIRLITSAATLWGPNAVGRQKLVKSG